MYPFTATQWKELELQTLIFNYMASDIPIPSHLIMLFRRSLLLMDPFPLYPPLSFDRKVEEDPEPWRCRRTDGKKWRCSKEASPESKYCERHMHRGKKCSRKHVEILPLHPTTNTNYNMCSYSPVDKMYFNLGLKEDVHEHNFFSPTSQPKCSARLDDEKGRHCFVMGADLRLEKPVKMERKGEEVERPKKPYIYLFNERVESKGSWMDPDEAYAKTQLSISIP